MLAEFARQQKILARTVQEGRERNASAGSTEALAEGGEIPTVTRKRHTAHEKIAELPAQEERAWRRTRGEWTKRRGERRKKRGTGQKREAKREAERRKAERRQAEKKETEAPLPSTGVRKLPTRASEVQDARNVSVVQAGMKRILEAKWAEVKLNKSGMQKCLRKNLSLVFHQDHCNHSGDVVTQERLW